MQKGDKNMEPYKLIALDMDGTLLDEHQTVSAENRQWIQAAAEAGVTVMLATGRGIQSALPYALDLQLQSPLVTVNGSEVWRSPHDLWKRTLMDAAWIQRMQQLALEKDTWYWAYAVEGIFNKAQWVENPASYHWLKFGYYTEDPQLLMQLRSTLEAWGELEISNSHPYNLEINPLGINKASGILEVCGLLGIKMSQVIAMGDGFNDIAMIRAAGLGVAMGNAQEAVKQAADVVAATNEDNGVARIIQKYVFQQ
jgi:HAD superfamily hydrolase (TIGR01484 family)